MSNEQKNESPIMPGEVVWLTDYNYFKCARLKLERMGLGGKYLALSPILPQSPNDFLEFDLAFRTHAELMESFEQHVERKRKTLSKYSDK